MVSSALAHHLVHRTRYSVGHVIGSVLLVCSAFFLLAQGWYPGPLFEASGVWQAFWIVFSVDVIAGPLLTFVVAAPNKPRRELVRDIAFIACCQLAVLLYGLYTVWETRPVYWVGAIDRVVLVTAPDLTSAGVESSRLPWRPQKRLATVPSDPEQSDRLMQEVLQGGADIERRPEHYHPWSGQPYTALWVRGKRLDSLLAQFPETRVLFQRLAPETLKEPDHWSVLPFKTPRTTIGIVLHEDARVAPALLPLSESILGW